MTKLTKRYKRMMEVYRHFGREFPDADWSEQAAIAQFEYESFGNRTVSNKPNGYTIGKHWFDLQVSEWREALNARDQGRPEMGVITVFDLYAEYPKWMVDMVVPGRLKQTEKQIDAYAKLNASK